MDAAVVELDPLPNPVRPSAQDHHRGVLAALNLTFGLLLPAGVVVGRTGLKLGSAGVNRALDTLASERRIGFERKLLQLPQKPHIYEAGFVDLFERGALAEGLEDEVVTLRPGRR